MWILFALAWWWSVCSFTAGCTEVSLSRGAPEAIESMRLRSCYLGRTCSRWYVARRIPTSPTQKKIPVKNKKKIHNWSNHFYGMKPADGVAVTDLVRWQVSDFRILFSTVSIFVYFLCASKQRQLKVSRSYRLELNSSYWNYAEKRQDVGADGWRKVNFSGLVWPLRKWVWDILGCRQVVLIDSPSASIYLVSVSAQCLYTLLRDWQSACEF